MRILLLILVLCLASARAQDATPEVRMLRLRDGSIQWGTIATHDPDGLLFVRLDTGGRARLAWSLLDPAEERDLRTRFGYVDTGADEVFVDADRLLTIDGQEIIGRVVGRTSDAILLKTRSGTLPIPVNRLAGAPARVQANALEIWTRPELYALQQSTTDLLTAAGNFELARFCERITDFAHAAEHYRKVREVDPAFRKEDVAGALQRATEKAARQDQIDWLTGIDELVVRRRFDEALARADAFAQKFADSPLLSDARHKKERVQKARERYMVERVGHLWPLRAAQMARVKSTEASFEAVLAYIDGQMQKDVLESVAKAVQAITKDVTSDAVRRLWTQRRKERWARGSYGLGTWLLGRDAALKGQELPKDEAKPPVNEADKQRAELEKKLSRFLQNQEMARKSKSNAEQKDDRDVAWKELPSAARAGWILAYYAENSGDFDVDPKPLFSACRECGGKGTRLITLAGANVAQQQKGKQSDEQVIECPTCHGLGIVRRISYR